MRISVLMSLFSKERPDYFDLSMKSVWNDQTRKPDEIVLVEDGPVTTELESIVNKWQQKIPVMKVVKLEKNQGLPVALNEGIKQCNCDYIARMDTDDIALPDRFKIQEEYLNIHPELAVLGGGVIEFNDEEGDMEPRIMPSTLKEIKAAIPKSCPFIHPAVFIKKSVFDNGIEYNPKSRKYQDLELWFNILSAGYEVANIDDLLIKFRKGSDTYVKRNKAAKAELMIVLRGIRKLYGLCTWRYIYPLLHYLFRLLPPKVCLFVYKHFIVYYWKNKNSKKH